MKTELSSLSQNNITVETLISNGYKKYVDSFKLDGDSSALSPYKGSYQKIVYGEKGKKYFINFDVYDFKNSRFSRTDMNFEIKISAHAQFESKDVGTINFELLDCNQKSLVQVEQWFEKMWMTSNCKHYSEDY